MGTKLLGTICPWGLNWLGTICLEGPIVGDQMSGDHMRLGPTVSQPIIFHFGNSCMYCREAEELFEL